MEAPSVCRISTWLRGIAGECQRHTRLRHIDRGWRSLTGVLRLPPHSGHPLLRCCMQDRHLRPKVPKVDRRKPAIPEGRRLREAVGLNSGCGATGDDARIVNSISVAVRAAQCAKIGHPVGEALVPLRRGRMRLSTEPATPATSTSSSDFISSPFIFTLATAGSLQSFGLSVSQPSEE